MLTVTSGAATLIRALSQKAGAPSPSGLRIVIDPRHDSLSMALAARPLPGDTVVASGSTCVFLSPAASQRLASRTLRADTTARRSSFFLSP
jgi:Fe-S cluster assembly iron-binding protein IscA